LRLAFVVALAVALTLTCLGCGSSGKTAASSSTGTAKEETLAQPLLARCNQMSGKRKVQVGEALANEFPEENTPRGPLGTVLALLAIEVCNKTTDKNFQPVPEVRGIVQEVQQFVQRFGNRADFFTALTTTGPGFVVGGEELKASEAFQASAKRLCRDAKGRIGGLVHKMNTQALLEFKSPDAKRLEAGFKELAAKLAQAASGTHVQDGHKYVASFEKAAGVLDGQARKLAKLDEEEQFVAETELTSELAKKEIALSSETLGVEACSDLFSVL
jgi:hypothetical protein